MLLLLYCMHKQLRWEIYTLYYVTVIVVLYEEKWLILYLPPPCLYLKQTFKCSVINGLEICHFVFADIVSV